MKTARWRNRCNPDWPDDVRSWLQTSGSLTVRLQQTHGQFRVEVRRQGCGRVLWDEAHAIGVRAGRQVRLRQVTLWAGGQARVVAHTAVKHAGAQSDWPFWRHLGTRSLGTVLFRDPGVRRGRLQFACLPQSHPLAVEAAQVFGRLAHSQSAFDGGVSGRRWYARRAVYLRAAGRTPLVVTEVFVSTACANGLHTGNGM